MFLWWMKTCANPPWRHLAASPLNTHTHTQSVFVPAVFIPHAGEPSSPVGTLAWAAHLPAGNKRWHASWFDLTLMLRVQIPFPGVNAHRQVLIPAGSGCIIADNSGLLVLISATSTHEHTHANTVQAYNHLYCMPALLQEGFYRCKILG